MDTAPDYRPEMGKIKSLSTCRGIKGTRSKGAAHKKTALLWAVLCYLVLITLFVKIRSASFQAQESAHFSESVISLHLFCGMAFSSFIKWARLSFSSGVIEYQRMLLILSNGTVFSSSIYFRIFSGGLINRFILYFLHRKTPASAGVVVKLSHFLIYSDRFFCYAVLIG